MRPAQKRELVEEIRSEYPILINRACGLLLHHRSMFYYKAVGRDDRALRMHIREIAHTKVLYGIDRVAVLLRREGWKDNKKRVYRIYRRKV